MRRLAAGLLLGFLVSALAVPAGGAGADADRIARRVDRAFVGGRLELEEAVTIGRFKIRLARWVLGFVDDEPDARFARRLIDGRLDGLLDAMVEEAGREGGRASGALGPLVP